MKLKTAIFKLNFYRSCLLRQRAEARDRLAWLDEQLAAADTELEQLMTSQPGVPVGCPIKKLLDADQARMDELDTLLNTYLQGKNP